MPTYTVDGWAAYGVAALAVAISSALRYAIGLLEPAVLYFAVFYPAVVVATLLGGYRPGLLATALSLLVVWYCFLPPEFEFAVKDRATVINITLFTVSSGFLVWLTDSYRKTVQLLSQADHERQILFDEMQHRSRNSLAVVQSILTNTLRDHPELSNNLLGRLRAVLSSDDLFLKDAQPGEPLRNVVNAELQPFGLDRYEAVGSEIMLGARHARNWALIVHELATNAAKYGALREPEGKVLLTWFVQEDVLNFEWREVGSVNPEGTSAVVGVWNEVDRRHDPCSGWPSHAHLRRQRTAVRDFCAHRQYNYPAWESREGRVFRTNLNGCRRGQQARAGSRATNNPLRKSSPFLDDVPGQGPAAGSP